MNTQAAGPTGGQVALGPVGLSGSAPGYMQPAGFCLRVRVLDAREGEDLCSH